MTLGERISQGRKSLGISQEELGARLGVSRQAVSKWERGTASPDMENLQALARELSIPLAQLTDTPQEPAGIKKAAQRRSLLVVLGAVGLVLLAIVLAMIVFSYTAYEKGPEGEQMPASPAPTQSGGEAVPTQGPESEFIPQDASKEVYLAFNRLVTGKSDLTAEESYTLRWTVFAGLSDLDWQSFGALGSTGREEDTVIALLTWLEEQQPYSASEIFRLQMGCQSKLDGWLTDSYAHVLCLALFQNPVAFVKGLACEGVEDTMAQAVSLAKYDAERYPVERQNTLEALGKACEVNTFTDKELQWAQVLLENLQAEEGAPYDRLPHTPADLAH